MPRDGNRLEGGLNAALKRMLVNHRGLPDAHMRRACEWQCYMQFVKSDPVLILIQHGQDAKTVTNHENNDYEPMSQPILFTGFDGIDCQSDGCYPKPTD